MRLNLQYSPKLYLGESIMEEKLEKIKEKLETKPLLSSVFVLTISKNASDQLEIYSARQLVQHYYQENPPCVIGLAADYEEALALVEQIVKECLDSRGDCKLKEYLAC